MRRTSWHRPRVLNERRRGRLHAAPGSTANLQVHDAHGALSNLILMVVLKPFPNEACHGEQAKGPWPAARRTISLAFGRYSGTGDLANLGGDLSTPLRFAQDDSVRERYVTAPRLRVALQSSLTKPVMVSAVEPSPARLAGTWRVRGCARRVGDLSTLRLLGGSASLKMTACKRGALLPQD